jgi:hypothetical protein
MITESETKRISFLGEQFEVGATVYLIVSRMLNKVANTLDKKRKDLSIEASLVPKRGFVIPF